MRKGQKCSEETRQKISNAHKGKHLSEESKQKISKALKGKKQSPEHIKKRIEPLIGKLHTEELKLKNSLSQIGLRCGDKNPMYGKKRPDLAERNKNKHMKGKENPNWRGGTSFLPYCSKFNKQLKEEIRKRDEYQCQFSGCLCTQLESKVLYNMSLIPHHIHYKKEDCYPNLITLCLKHHSIVNFNRDYWEKFFMNMLKIRGLL